MPAPSSWELKESSWGCDAREARWAAPHWCDSSTDDDVEDDEPQSPEEFGDELFEYLLALHEKGARVTARVVCSVAYLAAKSGSKGRVITLGLKPSNSSGNFQKHIDTVVRFDDGKDSLYELDMPGHSKLDVGRSSIQVAVAPGHELLHREF